MSSPLFDISQSLNKARWQVAEAPIDKIEQIMRAYDVPEIVARLLVGRGIPDDYVSNFLNPTLKDDFPDPFMMAGMEDAALYLAEAITKQRSIAIFGDFDVDGATSSAILYRFLQACGIKAPIYIPDRLKEGYGPNINALKQLKEQGAEIILMADCGTTAFETIQQGADLGLEIVILDHHEAEEQLPAAAHIINPKRQDDQSGLDMLAAVGVCFLFCVAVNSKLRKQGFYEGKKEPSLKDWLDVVALGTVCDMVPLKGPNRLFVRHGFNLMQETDNIGLRALIDVAGITGALAPYHAGFVLGPRINAGSRVHQADLGARLLSTDDPEEAKNIAWTLNDCNDKRKDIQAQMEFEAIKRIEEQGLDQNPIIIVDNEGWHPGLSGLVAGQIKEKYQKPACVITYAKGEQGQLEGRGSGRSVPGIHVAQAFIDARNEGLLTKGGGHAMAGGFTVMPDQLEALKIFLSDHISRQAESGDTQVITNIDAIISVRGLSPDLIRLIQNYVGPFGQEFEEPVFALKNVRLHNADVVGEKHIRTMVGDWEGGTRMKAMAFKAVNTPLGDVLLKGGSQAFHLLGTLKVDNWNGRDNVEMHIKDAVPLNEAKERMAS